MEKRSPLLLAGDRDLKESIPAQDAQKKLISHHPTTEIAPLIGRLYPFGEIALAIADRRFLENWD